MFGTQHNLYSTDSRWGFGGNTNFKICVGGSANFSIFRYQHVGIANAKFLVGGLSQRKDPPQVFLRRSGI